MDAQHFSRALAVFLVTTLATVSGGVAFSMAETQAGSLDPKSNPLALLHRAYRDSGWSSEQAIAFASRALGYDYPDIAGAPAPAPGSVLLDPKSNPLAIVYGAYRRSGWSPERSIEIAREALNIESEENCSAYLVYITYCGALGEMQLQLYLDGRCYEDPDGNPNTADGLQVCDALACQEGSRWLSLTVGAGCNALPATGTCIQMRIETPAVSIPCDRRDIFCSCFSETNPTVNCSAIEQCCCSSLTIGCNGCPSCTSPCPNP